VVLRPTVLFAFANKTVFDLEHWVIRIDGSLGWTHSRAIPIIGADGEIVEWFGAARDVTERKQVEETQRLLMNELNHRVKSMLATVHAIAQQTLRRSKDPAAFAESFGGRIQSMSRMHSLLTNTNWECVSAWNKRCRRCALRRCAVEGRRTGRASDGPGHGQHGPVEVYADQPSDVAALGQPSRHDTGPARHVQYALALRRLDAIE